MGSEGENWLCFKLCTGEEIRRLRVSRGINYAELEELIRTRAKIPGPFMICCVCGDGALQHLNAHDVPKQLHEAGTYNRYARLTVIPLPAPIRCPELPEAAADPQHPPVPALLPASQTQVVRPNERFDMMWTLDMPPATENNVHLRNVAGFKLEPLDDAIVTPLEDSTFVAHCTFVAPPAVGTYSSKFRCFDDEGNVMSEVMSITVEVIAPECSVVSSLSSSSTPSDWSEKRPQLDLDDVANNTSHSDHGHQHNLSLDGSGDGGGDHDTDHSFHQVMAAVGQALLVQDGADEDASYCFVDTVR